MLKVIILTDVCTLLGCIPSFHEQTIKGCGGSVYDFINYFFFHAFFNSVIYIPCDATVVFSCQILILNFFFVRLEIVGEFLLCYVLFPFLYLRF